MVFRRDSKVDAFQRQISALRNQLGGETDDYASADSVRSSLQPIDSGYRSPLPDLDFVRSGPSYPADREEYLPVSAPETASALPPVPSVDTFTSVIAHTTTWNGNLESSGSLHIHGRVEGSLTARDHIFIAEEAEVDAQVAAANVTIAGSVRGSIHCTERFEVLPRGNVAGDIRAPIVIVHEGAMIAGEVVMSATGDLRSSSGANTGMRAAQGGD